MKEYTKSEIVITGFTTEDIITTSGVNSGIDDQTDLDFTGVKDLNDLE